MASHIDAKYANGPMVAQWLEARGFHFHGNSPEAKRLSAWRNGGMADVYALDRMLVDSPYGLWELPDDVWLEARRPADLGTDWTPKPKPPRPAYRSRYPQLERKRWLVTRYVERGMTMGDIAYELGCHMSTVQAAMLAHGIPRRTPGTRLKAAA